MEGMGNVVGQLTTGMSADAMWTAVATVMPFVISIALFAFGYRMVRRVTKSGSKGKANI